MFDKVYKGHLEFRIATGNTGTGCAGEVQSEHGCEFAPVAGQNTICFEILSAPYKLCQTSVFDGQCRQSVKATERHFVIKKKYVLRTADIPCQLTQKPVKSCNSLLFNIKIHPTNSQSASLSVLLHALLKMHSPVRNVCIRRNHGMPKAGLDEVLLISDASDW